MRELMYGWLGWRKERAAFTTARAERHTLFRVFAELHPELPGLIQQFKDRPFTWDLERKLFATGRLPWELIPTHTQDTGNCVAAALAGAGMKLQVIEIALGGEEETFREWFVPWIYAISRNQIGGGMRGAGSTGAWGARAVNQYGVLFSDDSGVPEYEGTSDRWGNRRNVGLLSFASYGHHEPIAKDNPVAITRLSSVNEMVEVMDAGMQITIASSQGFRVTEYKGLHVYRPSGSWSHQMHITDIRRDPELMFYRMNQWGPGHTRPLNGETPGGAWNLASDLEKELRGRNREVYGYNHFKGDLGGPDYNIV